MLSMSAPWVYIAGGLLAVVALDKIASLSFLSRFVLLIPVSFTLCVCVAELWLGRSRLRRVTALARGRARQLLGDVDAWDVEGDAWDEVPLPSSPARRYRYSAYCARLAKAEFGLLKRTEANRLMVQKFIRDEMRSHNVRPTHVSFLLPIAVEATFLPTQSDLLAAQLRSTTDWVDRDKQLVGWGDIPTSHSLVFGGLWGWKIRFWGLEPGLEYAHK